MKTFAKKSLSVVLAMLMVLSTLTVGAMSAFAETTKTIDYKDNMVIDSETIKDTNIIKFVAPETGYYGITLTPSEKAADAGDAYAYFSTMIQDEDGEFNSFESSNSSYSVYVYSVNATTGVLENKEVYMPAHNMVSLTKGETYGVSVRINNNTNAVLSITASDYLYDLTTYEAELTVPNKKEVTYHYNPVTGEETETVEIKPYDVAYKTERTVGIGASVYGYDGASTTLAVPSVINGYVVKTATLGDTPNTLSKRITSVTIPEGVETVGGMSNFYALTSVNLPSSLKVIDDSAFSGCHSLAGRIVIPANVEYVGYRAFYDTAVTSVEFLGTETTVGDQAFGYKEVLNDATTNPEDPTFAKVDGFFVIAPATSYAAKFAANNGFVSYDRANCTAGNHPYAVTTVAATVFAKGSKTGVCPVCGTTTKTVLKKKTFKISALKSSKKNTLVVKAPAQKGMKGYKVEYSTSKKFTKKTTKTVTVKTTKALNKTIKGLKSGKKYYVRVRAYTTSGKKTIFSKYTTVKSVKIKK